jgi:hypothetical protein
MRSQESDEITVRSPVIQSKLKMETEALLTKKPITPGQN